MWYENKPDTTWLDYLVRTADSEQGIYSEISWAAYQTALKAAQALTVTSATTQGDLDAAAQAFADARNKLVVQGVAPEIQKIELLNPTVQLGKQVGLRVTTSAGVEQLSVDGEALSIYSSRIQILQDGENVKIWLLCFPADEAGSFTYTLRAAPVSGSTEQEQTATFQIQVNG